MIIISALLVSIPLWLIASYLKDIIKKMGGKNG
jgi:hypothetical protein